MSSSPDALTQLKNRLRATWMAGDFGKIALYSADAAEVFIDRLAIEPAAKVLDVACGTGNLAIPAARKGAVVTGVDIAPNLLEQARERAATEGLTLTLQEGDAEQLPYPDSEFDLVVSMFGAMFAPQPDLVARELFRVCRPGGIVAMANWTPQSFAGKTFALTARYVPPPANIPPPVLWGTEAVVRERFQSYTAKIEMTNRELIFDYPFPPADVVAFFRQYFGPTQTAYARLDASAQTAFTTDMEKLWSEHNEAESSKTFVRNHYLEVVASRPS